MKESIRKQILGFYIVTLLVVLLTGFILYGAFYKVIYHQVINDQKSALKNSKILVERDVKEFEDIFWEITMNRDIADLMFQDIEDAIDAIGLRNQLVEEILYIENKFSNRVTITLFVEDCVSAEKELTDWVNDPSLLYYMSGGVYSSHNVVHEVWFTMAKEDESYIQSFISPFNKDLVLIKGVKNPFVKPYISPYFNEVSMVMVLRFNGNELVEIMENSALAKDTTVKIYNSEDQEIFSYSQNAIDTSNDDVYIIEEHLKNKWKVIAYIPKSSITSKTNFVIVFIGLALLLIVLIIIIQGLWFNRRVINPVLSLSNIMKKTTSINMLHTANYTELSRRDDEIGELYRDFSTMNDKLKVSLIKEKEAEYKALQAQINPHFLYNTLDSIIWIALCEQQKQIADMTGKLAGILRYSINSPMESTTLKEELQHVMEYVNIEMVRYNNAFNFLTHIHDNAMDVSMPKFILQPLIENAINHGVMKNDGGTIMLSVEESQTGFIVVVTDDGEGSHAPNTNIKLSKNLPFYSKGIGVMNVHNRLKDYYVGAHGLTYLHNQFGGTTVLFLISDM